MIENRPVARVIAHLMLVLGIIIVAFPIYYTFVASSMTSTDIIRPPMSLLPGDHLGANYTEAMVGGVERVVGVSLERLLFNSFVVALAIAIGKIVISFLSAFAIVFFRFPFRMGFFWMIFITLMLPVEVRILPTYKVIVDLGLI
ncbi:MAG: glycerol-3-phosphate transporter, partial [Agrobacterium fabrum]